MGGVVEALDRGFLEGAVHPLYLTVCPRMPGLGQAMIEIVAGAGHVEGVSPERLLSFDMASGVQPSPWDREVGAVVRQHCVDLVRDGFDQVPQEVGGDTPRGLLVQLNEGELRRSIDATNR